MPRGLPGGAWAVLELTGTLLKGVGWCKWGGGHTFFAPQNGGLHNMLLCKSKFLLNYMPVFHLFKIRCRRVISGNKR